MKARGGFVVNLALGGRSKTENLKRFVEMDVGVAQDPGRHLKGREFEARKRELEQREAEGRRKK